MKLSPSSETEDYDEMYRLMDPFEQEKKNMAWLDAFFDAAMSEEEKRTK